MPFFRGLIHQACTFENVRKNGDRPHFLLLCPQDENVLFLTKWGLSPFFRILLWEYNRVKIL